MVVSDYPQLNSLRIDVQRVPQKVKNPSQTCETTRSEIWTALAYPGGGGSPPKIRSFENAGPNSQFRGI
jgi:hypothetical protein